MDTNVTKTLSRYSARRIAPELRTYLTSQPNRALRMVEVLEALRLDRGAQITVGRLLRQEGYRRIGTPTGKAWVRPTGPGEVSPLAKPSWWVRLLRFFGVRS